MSEERNYSQRNINWCFHALALSGGLASIFINSSESLTLNTRQDYSLYLLSIMGVGLLLSLFIFYPREIKLLVRNINLLVPFGLYLFIEIVLKVFSSLPFVVLLFSTEKKVVLFGLTAAVSLSSILSILNSVVLAGWTTSLILQLTKENKTDLIKGLRSSFVYFFRVMCVLAVGWLIPIIIIVPFITGGITQGNLYVLLFFILIFSLFWNLLTYAVLFFVIDKEKNFVQAIVAGIKASWSRKWRVAFPIVLQLLLLGSFTYIDVTYTNEKVERNVTNVNSETNTYKEITHSNSKTVNTNRNTKANVIWVGGYDNRSRWHEDLMETVESKELPITKFSIGVLLMILAIVIKLRIAQKIFVNPPPENYSIYYFDNSIRENIPLISEKEPFSQNSLNETDEPFRVRQSFLTVMILSTTFLIGADFAVKSLPERANENVKELNSAKEEEERQEVVNPNQFFKPRVLAGESFLSKKELYNAQNDSYFAEEKKNPVPLIYSDGYKGPYEPASLFAPSFDVYVGECDGKEGRDVVFTSCKLAFVLDESGNVKSRLKLGFGTLQSAPYDPEEYYGPTQVIDVEGDGRCEYIGTGSQRAALFGSDGRGIWRTPKTGRVEDEPTMSVGKMLGNKELQFIVVSNSDVELRNKNGETIWKKDINEDTVTAKIAAKDIDGDGCDEIFVITTFSTTILNHRGEIVKKIKLPVITHGIVQNNQNDYTGTLLFGFKNNRLFFFDLDGNQLAKYKAPYSEQDENFSSDHFLVFRANAIFVRLFKNEPPYLAVIADISGRDVYDGSMLYIYNDKGKLVYQEILSDYSNKITAMTQNDGSGTETLLVGLEDIVWQYSVK